MKKAVYILIFAFFSISGLFAARSKNITLIIQGNGPLETVEGFKYALKIEANAAGYDVSDNPAAAKYSIRFNVVFDQAEQKFRFTVSLIKMADQSEIVTMEYLFTDEEEMLLYSQLVFFMLMANLPEDEIGAPEDDSWRNKYLYLSASFDYSLMLLELSKNNDLMGGIGMYNDSVTPKIVAPLDNKIIPMIGISLGLEYQFLNFMSVEPKIHISMEEVLKNNIIFNALCSLDIKAPLKFFGSFVIAPYLEAAYPMRFRLGHEVREVFFNYPKLGYGGGVQTAVKMGKNGALFFDVGYLYFGETGLKNQFTDLYPKPSVIKYNYSLVSFRVGYKYGFFNRKTKKN